MTIMIIGNSLSKDILTENVQLDSICKCTEQYLHTMGWLNNYKRRKQLKLKLENTSYRTYLWVN